MSKVSDTQQFISQAQKIHKVWALGDIVFSIVKKGYLNWAFEQGFRENWAWERAYANMCPKASDYKMWIFAIGY